MTTNQQWHQDIQEVRLLGKPKAKAYDFLISMIIFVVWGHTPFEKMASTTQDIPQGSTTIWPRLCNSQVVRNDHPAMI